MDSSSSSGRSGEKVVNYGDELCAVGDVYLEGENFFFAASF